MWETHINKKFETTEAIEAKEYLMDYNPIDSLREVESPPLKTGSVFHKRVVLQEDEVNASDSSAMGLFID